MRLHPLLFSSKIPQHFFITKKQALLLIDTLHNNVNFLNPAVKIVKTSSRSRSLLWALNNNRKEEEKYFCSSKHFSAVVQQQSLQTKKNLFDTNQSQWTTSPCHHRSSWNNFKMRQTECAYHPLNKRAKPIPVIRQAAAVQPKLLPRCSLPKCIMMCRIRAIPHPIVLFFPRFTFFLSESLKAVKPVAKRWATPPPWNSW